MELEGTNQASRLSIARAASPIGADLARSISALLTRSSADLMESRGGHVPDQVVTNIIHRHYTSIESVVETFAAVGHRFVVASPSGELVATVLVSSSPDIVLGSSASQPVGQSKPDLDPSGYHSIFNMAVAHPWRRLGIASAMLQHVAKHHRRLFSGNGWWARAEPPDHDLYLSLGFTHSFEHDSYFNEPVTPSARFDDIAAFNQQYICGCSRPSRGHDGRGKLRHWAFAQDLPIY